MEDSEERVRRLLIQKRLGLGAGEIIKKSNRIARRVMVGDIYKDAKNISLYLPINGEVKTGDIINFLIEAGVNIYLPKYFKVEKVYRLSRFRDWKRLEKGPYKILQPRDDEVIETKKIDTAIIPGVAFDKKGLRLGYGKGVFDRLFAKSEAIKVGLAYDFQIVDELPKKAYDLLVDLVVTEKRVLRCKAT